MRLTTLGGPVDGDDVADADRLLEEENQPGNEIRKDVLQRNRRPTVKRGHQPLDVRTNWNLIALR